MKTTAETPEKTLEILEENGWTQGRSRNDDGEYCVWGAIEAAVLALPLTNVGRHRRQQRVIDALKRTLGLKISIIDRNELAAAAIVASVRAALEEAIKAERDA